MSPGGAVCAATRCAGTNPSASTTAAAMICITVTSSQWAWLFFNKRPVDRQVYHRSLPVIVLDQHDIGHGMAILHLRPYADGEIARIVVLRFLDGLPELARRAEHAVVLLLRGCQIVSTSYSIGLGDLAGSMIDDHFEILGAVLDSVDGQLRLAVFDFELAGNRLAVAFARCQALLQRNLGAGDRRSELSLVLIGHGRIGGDYPQCEGQNRPQDRNLRHHDLPKISPGWGRPALVPNRGAAAGAVPCLSAQAPTQPPGRVGKAGRNPRTTGVPRRRSR